MVASSTILIADTPELRARCFPVMQQLRPHFTDVARFLQQVDRQHTQAGYRLACVVDDEDAVAAVAGFRITESLSWGHFLYVDDLVTDHAKRSRGHGSALLAWLADYARDNGCAQLHLDSGNQRLDAHRFYEREGMACTCKHFSTVL